MRRSEKILLAILIFGLLAWQGERQVSRLVVAPIRRGHAELERLDRQIAEQARKAATLKRVDSQFAHWQQRSLPPDPLTAQRLYQQWLTDLALDCGFDDPKVFPDRVTRKHDACVGVLVSIDAGATLDQLCLFLSRFYRTDLVQQITTLSIDSTQNRGDPVLRVTLMAEGLSLQDARQRQRLFLTGTLADDLNENDTAARISDIGPIPDGASFLVRIGGEYMHGVRLAETQWNVQRGADHSTPAAHPRGEPVEFIPLIVPATDSPAKDYTQLIAQNPFSKPMPKQVVQAPPAREEVPDVDPAEYTYLVGAFAEDQRRQAWLYDRLNNENVVIGPGKAFAIAGIEGVVQEIGDDYVVLYHGDALWRLRIGKNLRSMERMTDSTTN